MQCRAAGLQPDHAAFELHDHQHREHCKAGAPEGYLVQWHFIADPLDNRVADGKTAESSNQAQNAQRVRVE